MSQPRAHGSRFLAARRFRRGAWSVVALPALLLAAPALAEPAERARFIGRFLCEITEKLAEIHRHGPVTTSKDRFLTVGLLGRAQHYVQCIFQDSDTAMFCEASSGAYRYTAAAGVRLQQSAESMAALRALGYAQPDPQKNFSREVVLGDPPDVRIAARLMLATLHDAFGAGSETVLEGNGPLVAAKCAATRP